MTPLSYRFTPFARVRLNFVPIHVQSSMSVRSVDPSLQVGNIQGRPVNLETLAQCNLELN